jgi:hypothetical protein
MHYNRIIFFEDLDVNLSDIGFAKRPLRCGPMSFIKGCGMPKIKGGQKSGVLLRKSLALPSRTKALCTDATAILLNSVFRFSSETLAAAHLPP